MKNNIIFYFLCFLLFGCTNEGKQSNVEQQEKATEPPKERVVKNNVIISGHLPEIEIKVEDSFEYVGKFDFEIIASSEEYEPEILGKAIAAGERMVFVEADESKIVNKLFIVQFEGFLPQYNFTYNYNFDQAGYIGENKYRHNTWFYSSKQLAIENPKNEGAKTRKFLEDKGYILEDEFMMSRFVGLASEDRINEIIIYHLEMLQKNTGHTLEELENTVDKSKFEEIKNALIERSKKSFSIVKG